VVLPRDGFIRFSKFSQGSFRAASINNPKTISRLPAILLSNAELGLIAKPVKPAIAPRVIKIMEKPITKLSEWRNRGTRLLTTPVSNISGPYRLERYTGTKGTTQGDRKDSNPALKAATIEMLGIAYPYGFMNDN